MCEIFYIPDPLNKSENWDLFTNKAIFTMRQIKKYIEGLYKDKQGNKKKLVGYLYV